MFNVISNKYHVNLDPPTFRKYEVIKIDKGYKLSLEKIDSVLHIEIRGGYAPKDYYIFDELFWSNDSIKTDVYKSHSIYTKFIEVSD